MIHGPETHIPADFCDSVQRPQRHRVDILCIGSNCTGSLFRGVEEGLTCGATEGKKRSFSILLCLFNLSIPATASAHGPIEVYSDIVGFTRNTASHRVFLCRLARLQAARRDTETLLIGDDRNQQQRHRALTSVFPKEKKKK